MPYFIATAATPAFGMYDGTPSGETDLEPLSRITSWLLSTVWMPPIPVASTHPTRIGS